MYQFPPLGSIKIRRKKLGLTQQSLSKQVGISQSLLAKVEAGQVIPNYEIASRLFEKLDELENSDSKKVYEVANRKVIILKHDDSVSKAIRIAIKNGISQFPIEKDGKIVGAITTSDLLDANKKDMLENYISYVMPIVNKNMPVSTVRTMLKSSRAVLVEDFGKIVGIVTPEEVL